MGIKRRTSALTDLLVDSDCWMDDLVEETDRGIVLAGAAFIDDALRALLSAAFVDGVAVRKRLLDGDRPLSTLAARIDLAYAMGLIGPEMRTWAHILRDIRNCFAHEHRPADLSAPELKPEVDKLRALPLLHAYVRGYAKASGDVTEPDPKRTVLLAIVLLTTQLLKAVPLNEARRTSRGFPHPDRRIDGRTSHLIISPRR